MKLRKTSLRDLLRVGQHRGAHAGKNATDAALLSSQVVHFVPTPSLADVIRDELSGSYDILAEVTRDKKSGYYNIPPDIT